MFFFYSCKNKAAFIKYRGYIFFIIFLWNHFGTGTGTWTKVPSWNRNRTVFTLWYSSFHTIFVIQCFGILNFLLHFKVTVIIHLITRFNKNGSKKLCSREANTHIPISPHRNQIYTEYRTYIYLCIYLVAGPEIHSISASKFISTSVRLSPIACILWLLSTYNRFLLRFNDVVFVIANYPFTHNGTTFCPYTHRTIVS